MRKPLSNKQRFEIFRRDGFTCQYCGANGEGVKLRVDHIHPVKEGGECESGNFITACHECNSGKATRLVIEPEQDFGKMFSKLTDMFSCICCGKQDAPWDDDAIYTSGHLDNFLRFDTPLGNDITITLCLECITKRVNEYHSHRHSVFNAMYAALRNEESGFLSAIRDFWVKQKELEVSDGQN